MSAEPSEEGFAAFASFLGTPLPENPIQALLILRKEAAAEIDRLVAFLDALGGDPDLEDGADDEPTLGWPVSGRAPCVGSDGDGELEPSLGWTANINQASRNRLGEGEDYEHDDCDKEDSDPGEDDGTAEHEPDSEPDHDTEEAFAPTREYRDRLFTRRGQANRMSSSDLSLILIGPNGERQEIDRLGYPVKP